MVEIHVVGAPSAPRHASLLDSYHRWRHLIYIEERGWTDLNTENGRERDQFDTEDAVHLIAVLDGDVVGGSRLIPMAKPTLLATVFPHLVEHGAMPTDSQSFEWTRMFVVPAHRLGRRSRSVGGALLCSVMDYCCTVGARRVGGVQETYWLPRWHEFGWTVRPLGLPQEIAGSMTLAAFMDVSADALAGARAATGWSESLLVWDAAPAPRRTMREVA